MSNKNNQKQSGGITLRGILQMIGLAAVLYLAWPFLVAALVGGGDGGDVLTVTAVPQPGPALVVATPTLAPGAAVITNVVQPAPTAAAPAVPEWSGDAAVAGEAIVQLVMAVTEQLKACTLQQAADPLHNYRCYQYRDQLSQLNDQARQLARDVNGGGQQ